MKVWRIKPDKGDYKTLISKENIGLKIMIDLLAGKRQNGKYDNLEVKIAEGDETKESDFILFWNVSGSLIINFKTKLAIENMLKDSVEFIPVKLEDTILYIFNVVKVIDAIDYENAVLKKQSNGLVVGMEEYSFIEDRIEELAVFKVYLKDKVCMETFVTEKFKKIVDDNNLSGLEFTEVWASES